MAITNNWKDFVSDKVLVLLERSIERRVCDAVKHPFIPSSGERYIFHKKYNKLGEAVFHVEVKTGIELSQSTKKRDMDNIDVFWFDCFLSLGEKERLAVIGYVDPFHELQDRNDFIAFVKETDLNSTRGFNQILEDAMFKLQKYASQRGIVEKMDSDTELRGWKSIADYWGTSIPTMMKIVFNMKLPVIYVDGGVFALKSKLDEARMKLYQDEGNYIWKNKGRRTRRK